NGRFHRRRRWLLPSQAVNCRWTRQANDTHLGWPMLSDAEQLESGTTLQADVCIAGAGAAGITLALALKSAGLHVLLLESGGLGDEAESQALYQGSMSGLSTWELDTHRWRLFGGSTSRWAGWCRP